MITFDRLLDRSRSFSEGELSKVEAALRGRIELGAELRIRRSWIGQGHFDLRWRKVCYVFTRQDMSPLRELHLASRLTAELHANHLQLTKRQVELMASALCLQVMLDLETDRESIVAFLTWFYAPPNGHLEQIWNEYRIDLATNLLEDPHRLKDIASGDQLNNLKPMMGAKLTEELSEQLARVALQLFDDASLRK